MKSQFNGFRCFTSNGIEDSDHYNANDFADINDNDNCFQRLSSEPNQFNLEELRDLIRDLRLSMRGSLSFKIEEEKYPQGRNKIYVLLQLICSICPLFQSNHRTCIL